MHHDVDLVQPEPEQQVRLDHLQALVHQGGGVDRDQRPHLPGGMGQGLFRRDVGQGLAAPAAEGPAAGGQHQPPDLGSPPGPQALGDGRVLGVDRDDLPGLGPAGDQRAADDQRLLVGQGQRPPGVQRGQRGLQPGRAAHPVEHHVSRPRGDLADRVRPGQNLGQGGGVPTVWQVGGRGGRTTLRSAQIKNRAKCGL
jgi:hypothetical protein